MSWAGEEKVLSWNGSEYQESLYSAHRVVPSCSLYSFSYAFFFNLVVSTTLVLSSGPTYFNASANII